MKTFKEFFQLGVTKPSKFDVQNYLNGLGTRLMQLSDIKKKIINHFKNIKNLQLDTFGRKVLSFEEVIREENEDIDEVKFQTVTVKDKSGKSHSMQTRIRPGTTHVAIMHHDTVPASRPGEFSGTKEVSAHTVLSFGSMDKLTKVINHAKKKFGLKKVEIQKLDKKYL